MSTFLLQQVGGKGVAKRVHGNAFIDLGQGRSVMDGALELTCAQRLKRIKARKQPAVIKHLALGACHPPPYP